MLSLNIFKYEVQVRMRSFFFIPSNPFLEMTNKFSNIEEVGQ